ncbi:hypothetical protein OIU84_028967 [Salix udensis]|uniref:Uncharacterized protein n=1 Tax=Salix udensis TaxID=889485 RepID=A0AAD6KDS5_9ROSI|nr:hypothetical protein OIU84_028967 [Salix udensis]
MLLNSKSHIKPVFHGLMEGRAKPELNLRKENLSSSQSRRNLLSN